LFSGEKAIVGNAAGLADEREIGRAALRHAGGRGPSKLEDADIVASSILSGRSRGAGAADLEYANPVELPIKHNMNPADFTRQTAIQSSWFGLGTDRSHYTNTEVGKSACDIKSHNCSGW